MKRVTAAIIIVFVIIAISSLALWDMQHSLAGISTETQALRDSVKELTIAERTDRCRRLMDQWDSMEGRFLLYVRHDHLDSIMEHLSELPSFSEEDDESELLSNLDAALRMMEHLWESVKPSYRTLL